MNRGTALKWADRLESGSYRFDAAQLRIDAPEGLVHCPLGVLADFLDPDGWAVAWDGVSGLWHGSQFGIPEVGRKRAKMKTNGLEPMKGFGVSFCDWVSKHCHDHPTAAAFVRDNYSVI